jgi:hypothetical protein
MTASRIMPCCWLVPRADHCRAGGLGRHAVRAHRCVPMTARLLCRRDIAEEHQSRKASRQRPDRMLPGTLAAPLHPVRGHSGGSRSRRAPHGPGGPRHRRRDRPVRRLGRPGGPVGSVQVRPAAPVLGWPHSRMRADTQKAQLPEASCAQQSGHTEVTENGDWHSLTVYFHRSTALRSVP